MRVSYIWFGFGTTILLSIVAGRASAQDGPWRLVRIAQDAPIEVLASFDHVSKGEGYVETVATDEDLARLGAYGVPFEVVVDDLQAYYRTFPGPQYGTGPSPPFGFGSMGGYYTFAEVLAKLDLISAQWPNLATPRYSIGTSLEGRDLWVIKISDNPGVDEGEPEVWFDALHHAREPEGMMALFHFVSFLLQNYGTDPLATYLVNEREIFVLPVVNPDGYVYNQTTNPGGGGLWRKNRRPNAGGSFGVDLNRNYGFQWGFDDVGSSPNPSSETYRGTGPFSEPETAAIAAYVATRPIVVSQSIHTYSSIWLHPWGYTATLPPDAGTFVLHSQFMTELSGYPYGTIPALLYLANGNAIDWHYGVEGILAYSVEIGLSSQGGFWPPSTLIVPLAEENEQAFARVAWVAGGCVQSAGTQVLEVAGDGDGTLEAGETGGVVATVQNLGASATGTSTVLSLASADPYVTLLDVASDLGALAALASASNAGDPLTFLVSPATPPGSTLALTLGIQYEGFTDSRSVGVPIGEPRTFARDDLEIDLAWTVGAPGDAASSGVWVRVDPNGTTSAGQQAQPENDNTPAPGVQAYVTGNAAPGAGAGSNDVDGGPTTLLTPVFDLTDAVEPRVAYARWFADFTQVDDALVVSISNDGGASWTALETVSGSGQNAWNESSFRVADFVAPTATMRLRFVISDNPNNSLCEGAVDDLRVLAFNVGPTLSLFGAASPGKNVSLGIGAVAGQLYGLFVGLPGPPFSIPGVSGQVELLPSSAFAFSGGTVPADGFRAVALGVPNAPALVGATVAFQAILVGPPAAPALTNGVTVTIF
jgi:hypothetical protein